MSLYSRDSSEMPRLMSLFWRISLTCLELAFFAAPQGDGLGFLVELDLGFDAFEIEALGDFLGGLVDGVIHLLPVHFGGNVK